MSTVPSPSPEFLQWVTSALLGGLCAYFMGRMADREFLRRWVENTYAPRKEMESEFAALKGRIQSMEERQKEEHAENSNRLDQIISILSARAGKRVGD